MEYYVWWSNENLALPRDIKLVAYADDLALVVLAKHFEEIRLAFDITFEIISRWIKAGTGNAKYAEGWRTRNRTTAVY